MIFNIHYKQLFLSVSYFLGSLSQFEDFDSAFLVNNLQIVHSEDMKFSSVRHIVFMKLFILCLYLLSQSKDIFIWKFHGAVYRQKTEEIKRNEVLKK